LAEKDWKQIAESPAFRELVRKKRAFIIPSVVFFFVFYFTLPVLTAYTTVLNGKVIGSINWAYLYAFAQFAMTWILCHLYMNKAAKYDELVAKVKNESVEKGVRTG